MSTHEELFEVYLKGGMSVTDRADFDARLLADPSFAEEFRAFRAAAGVVRIAGEQRLKAKLAAIHAEVLPSGDPRVIPISQRWWLAIAASLLVLIGSYYYFASQQASTSDLYAEYMMPYQGPDRERGADGAGYSAWMRFADTYADARYDEAIIELDGITTDAAPAYLIAFYRGQCQMLKATPDHHGARRSFEEVLASDNDLHASARWYLGLAAMKQGDRVSAREQFTALRDAGSYKHAEAARLLEALPDQE